MDHGVDMIYSRFLGVSRRHFDYNPVDCALLWNTQINNLNEKAKKRMIG